jgi:hypothetical protein
MINKAQKKIFLMKLQNKLKKIFVLSETFKSVANCYAVSRVFSTNSLAAAEGI